MTAKGKKIILSAVAICVVAGIVFVLFFWRIPFLTSKYDRYELTRERIERECPKVLLTNTDIEWLVELLELQQTQAISQSGESISFMLSGVDAPFHPDYDGVDCQIKLTYDGDNVRVIADSERFDVNAFEQGSFYISAVFPYGNNSDNDNYKYSKYFKTLSFVGLDGQYNAHYYARDFGNGDGFSKVQHGYGLINQLQGEWDALMGV